VVVVVCGGGGGGARSADEAAAARALAREGGVAVLGVRFAAGGACAAATLPALGPEAREALLAHVLGARA
jgi:hypothetical protein